LGVHLLLILLLGGVAILIQLTEGPVWEGATGLALCMILSLVLRAGWVGPCMVCAAILGTFSTLGLRNGTREAQVWEDIQSISIFTAFGMALGFLIEYGRPLPEAAKTSKRFSSETTSQKETTL
jgi:hypothetical protein